MISLGPDGLNYVLLTFCRIGGCLMLMPGFSSPRVPVRIRLFIALSLSAALTPIAMARANVPAGELTPIVLLPLVVSELLFGMFIGLLGRFFFLALETIGAAISNAIGMTNNLGVPMESDEPAPALAALMTLVATMLIFATDLHWEVVRGLASSYAAAPLGQALTPRSSLVELVDLASHTFGSSLRIAGPFLIFSLLVNLAFGLVNKMAPQAPVYFVSLPFVVTGGLWLFYALAKPAFQIFIVLFSMWVTRI
ncbi:MAG TPA: flagellar biosynthetic protein FliR [Beijerinckiaceae bacterium]|jgi:flagellar biosynthetic protein FliR